MGWTDRINFDKIPTEAVEKLWNKYQILPTGQPRLDFRAANPELDEWMLLTGKVSKLVGDRGTGEGSTGWSDLAGDITDTEKILHDLLND